MLRISHVFCAAAASIGFAVFDACCSGDFKHVGQQWYYHSMRARVKPIFHSLLKCIFDLVGFQHIHYFPITPTLLCVCVACLFLGSNPMHPCQNISARICIGQQKSSDATLELIYILWRSTVDPSRTTEQPLFKRSKLFTVHSTFSG